MSDLIVGGEIKHPDWPRVTAVLAEMGFIAGVEFMPEEAKIRGRILHKIFQYDLEGVLNESTIDSRLMGYYDGFKKFKVETDFVPLELEVPVEHPLLLYRGTPDCIGKINGDLAVIDWKSGAKQKWHPLQLAAYRACKNKGPMKRFGVIFPGNGKYKLEPYDNHREDERAWSGLVYAYHWRKNYA